MYKFSGPEVVGTFAFREFRLARGIVVVVVLWKRILILLQITEIRSNGVCAASTAAAVGKL